MNASFVGWGVRRNMLDVCACAGLWSVTEPGQHCLSGTLQREEEIVQGACAYTESWPAAPTRCRQSEADAG